MNTIDDSTEIVAETTKGHTPEGMCPFSMLLYHCVHEDASMHKQSIPYKTYRPSPKGRPVLIQEMTGSAQLHHNQIVKGHTGIRRNSTGGSV